MKIFLFPTSASANLARLVKQGLVLIDRSTLFENCSDASFNENKYFGTICYELGMGNNVILSNAEQLLSKKGSLSLIYHLTARLGSAVMNTMQLVFVSDSDLKDVAEKQLRDLVEKIGTSSKVSLNAADSVSRFDDELAKITNQIENLSLNCKATCGFICSYTLPNTIMTGHKTVAFGISLDDARAKEQELAQYMNKVCKGQLINLIIDGKAGGSIMQLPDFDPTAHITINTDIRSVLSGAVLEKYNAGVTLFRLSDIDKAAKKDKVIQLDKGSAYPVTVNSWYTYLLENKSTF